MISGIEDRDSLADSSDAKSIHNPSSIKFLSQSYLLFVMEILHVGSIESSHSEMFVIEKGNSRFNIEVYALSWILPRTSQRIPLVFNSDGGKSCSSSPLPKSLRKGICNARIVDLRSPDSPPSLTPKGKGRRNLGHGIKSLSPVLKKLNNGYWGIWTKDSAAVDIYYSLKFKINLPTKLEIAMSPASKSKSKDKRVAGREPQKSSTKPTSITNTGGSVPTSGYNTLLGTFHALETKDRIGNSVGMGIEYDV
ncbi:hypothetical protein Tco_0768221 [Tanacetum coccineum]